MAELTEKRKKRIIEQMLRYANIDTTAQTSLMFGHTASEVKKLHRRAFTMVKDPGLMMNLIQFLSDHQAEIAVIMKWANLNKQAVRELNPEIIQDVQNLIRAQEVQES